MELGDALIRGRMDGVVQTLMIQHGQRLKSWTMTNHLLIQMLNGFGPVEIKKLPGAGKLWKETWLLLL